MDLLCVKHSDRRHHLPVWEVAREKFAHMFIPSLSSLSPLFSFSFSLSFVQLAASAAMVHPSCKPTEIDLSFPLLFASRFAGAGV